MIMNKKLLFAAMSLAALTACTDNDFESKNAVQQEASPVVFEVLNNNDAFTRASMNGNTISWSATDGDLFTLYHGGALAGTALAGYDNATYTASAGEGSAALTSPTMIKPGPAIMVWPADTTFYAAASGNLTVKIPATLENIENNIPYVSDLINIAGYGKFDNDPTSPTYNEYNSAGKDRKYTVYMRPMASQLILKADYAGTDAAINALATGDDPIDPIALTSVDITDTGNKLTQELDLSFAAPAGGQGVNWATVDNNAWTDVTAFDVTSAVKVGKLTTKCIDGIESAKFLILPQTNIGGAYATAGIVVNTTYGKVDISAAGGYSGTDLADAWYRYQAPGTAAVYGETATTTAGTGSDATKVRYTNTIQGGLGQVIDAFSANTTKKATSVVVAEPTGAVGTRYVKVLLSKLDMNGLHITSDKQLYDAVRVWKEIGTGDVTVRLDGDATTGEIEISQKTIAKINEINAELAEGTTPRKFNVTACNVAGEICNTIVITGGGAVQNMDFIDNSVAVADVALKAGETWEWAASTTAAKTLTLATATGVKSIINKGTFVSGATATLAIYDNAAVPVQITTVPFRNEGTWNITGGDINVQFDVTNVGTVNISYGAEYHQDGAVNVFTNDAETLPQRFVLNDPSILPAVKAAFVEKIGLINNSGVLACVNGGKINNYGLIEHKELTNTSAKTYITSNMSLNTDGFSADASFASGFNPLTSGLGNKIGRINLPYDNRNEVNVSIAGGVAAQGFVSVTVSSTSGAPSGGKLKLKSGELGEYVNYCIIEGAVTEISEVDNKIKYVEFDAGTTEIMWNVATAVVDGMVAFSPVNVKRNCIVEVDKSVYLAAKMYVGGHVYDKGTTNTIINTKCTGYFGDTKDNFATMYLTY